MATTGVQGRAPAAVPWLPPEEIRTKVAHPWLIGQGHGALLQPAKLLRVNVAAVQAYQPRGKPLKLIREEHPRAADSLALIREHQDLGRWEELHGSLEGLQWVLHIFTVPAERVAELQERLAVAVPGGNP